MGHRIRGGGLAVAAALFATTLTFPAATSATALEQPARPTVEHATLVIGHRGPTRSGTSENYFLPVNYQVGSNPAEYGRAIAEQVAYLRTGIDGLFTDQPDIGVVARSQFEQSRQAAPAA